MVANSSPTNDGRVARRLENRVRILDALFELIRADHPHPTLKEVADRAGVTPRTLLNHFPDGGALLAAAVVHGRELADRDMPSLPTHEDPEERVRAFFVSAIDFYESWAAIRWSILTFRGTYPNFDQRRTKGAVMTRVHQMVHTLVEGFDIPVDRELRRALHVMIDPLAWRLLRAQQKLSRSEAAASMARGVIALARHAQSQAPVQPTTRAKSSPPARPAR